MVILVGRKMIDAWSPAIYKCMILIGILGVTNTVTNKSLLVREECGCSGYIMELENNGITRLIEYDKDNVPVSNTYQRNSISPDGIMLNELYVDIGADDKADFGIRTHAVANPEGGLTITGDTAFVFTDAVPAQDYEDLFSGKRISRVDVQRGSPGGNAVQRGFESLVGEWSGGE